MKHQAEHVSFGINKHFVEVRLRGICQYIVLDTQHKSAKI